MLDDDRAVVPLPAARDARMKSRLQHLQGAPRASRAKTGMLKMPMAMMALTAPGPSHAVIMIADSTAGKAKVKSASRITASSISPPRAAASRPSATPSDRPMPTATKPTAKELRDPTINIDSTSRPNWSVPSQCRAEGGCRRATMSMSAYG